MNKLIQIKLSVVLLYFALSCNNSANRNECEPVGEYFVGDYKIVKLRCPDLVLAFSYSFDIYKNGKKKVALYGLTAAFSIGRMATKDL